MLSFCKITVVIIMVSFCQSLPTRLPPQILPVTKILVHTEPLLNSLHGVQWGSRPTENFGWRNVSLSLNWIQQVLLILTQAFQEATWVPTFAKMKPRLLRDTCKHDQKYTHIRCGIMSRFKVLPNQYTGGGKTQTKKWKPIRITEMTAPFQTKHQNGK